MSHQTKIVKVRNQLVHLQLPGRCKICGASLPVKTEVLSEGYTSNMRGLMRNTVRIILSKSAHSVSQYSLTYSL